MEFEQNVKNIEKVTEATLRLFKCFVDDLNVPSNHKILTKNGVTYLGNADASVIELGDKLYGKRPSELNRTFQGSFHNMVEKDIEQLIAEQVTHYFTTYGLERLGLGYQKNLIFIPATDLDIPELEEGIQVTLIQPISRVTLHDRLMQLLSGIALSNQTMDDIMTLSDAISRDELDQVKNRDIKIRLLKKYGLVPENPVEFLQFVYAELTSRAMIVQSKRSMDELAKLASKSRKTVLERLEKYVSRENGYIELSKIFNRYKKFFVSLKQNELNSPTPIEIQIDTDPISHRRLNAIINRISKLSKKYHEPMKSGLLDNLTKYQSVEAFEQDKERLVRALDNATIFRCVRLVNVLRFYSNERAQSIVYKIRNGRSFASELEIEPPRRELCGLIAKFVEDYVKQRVQTKAVKLYIPENVTYMLPVTEKQFSGEVPAGSSITLKNSSDLVVGVHWFDLEESEAKQNDCDTRVDIDLHVSNANEQFGWHTQWRAEDAVYSGDLTAAPRETGGASECFLIKHLKDKPNAFTVSLNLFTNNGKVPFHFFIAEYDSEKEFKLNYTVNPNKILYQFHSSFEDGQSEMTLGQILIENESVQFIFGAYGAGNSRVTAGQTEYKTWARNYDMLFAETSLRVHELFETTENKDESTIDLSLENISKETFIALLNGTSVA